MGHRVEEVRRTKKRKKAGAGAPIGELVGGDVEFSILSLSTGIRGRQGLAAE